MLRFLKWLFLGFGSLFLVTLLVVGTFGYVNDHRVDLPDVEEMKPIKEFFQKYASVLTTPIQHRYQQNGGKKWEDALAEFTKNHKQPLISQSARFISPYQIYLTLGSYPTRVEGRDSLFIAGGDEIVLAPQLDGEYRLDFAGAALGDSAEVLVSVDGLPFGSLTSQAVDEPRDRDTFFYRNFGRYWDVDSTPPGGAWRSYRKLLSLTKNSEVRLQCKSSKGHCAVTDPTFYQKSKADKPNLMLIMVDTLRGDAINEEDAPFLAALTKKGTHFSNALAAGNMTSPSTNGMLSCRKPSDLRDVAFAYSVSKESRERHYSEQAPSFPAMLQKNYDTVMLGNLSVISEVIGAGVQHGFSQQVAMETEGYETPHLGREALSWLKQEGDKSFFLYLHFNAPHAAYRAPLQDIFATYPGLKGFGSRAAFLQWMYRAEVHFTDRYIAKVFEALDKLGLKRETTVAIAADHGDHFKPHHFAFNKAGPQYFGSFFDHGATFLNDEVRVPMMILPAESSKPQAVKDYVSLLDVGPTLLEMGGVETPEWCAGKSLAPYVQRGPGAVQAAERIIGVEGYGKRAIVFENRYKYVRAYSPLKKKILAPDDYSPSWAEVFIGEELYDLEQDPHEEKNVAQLSSEVLAKARRAYDEYYGVESEYELVLESPQPTSFRIWMESKPKVSAPDEARIFEFSDGTRILGELKNRVVISLKDWKPSKITVNFNDDKQDILLTSLGLPIDFRFVDKIPREFPAKEEDKTTPNAPRVFMRRVIKSDVEGREIIAGNKQFEQILRDWGYLNDNT